MAASSEQALRSAWLVAWRGTRDKVELARMLHATLFLASLTAILSAYGWLDWIDVLALKFIPEHRFEQKVPPQPTQVRTLILGITQDLFETQFGAHTPINRDRFQALIESTLAAYPHARVLAIDYDLSPSAGDPCAVNADDSACTVTRSERAQQATFERYLTGRFAAPSDGGGCRVHLVMITPLKPRKDYADASTISVEQQWLARMRGGCVRFGDHALLAHNWLETVVKHRAASATTAACDGRADADLPFAEAVNRARRCAGVLRDIAPGPEDQVQLINFSRARNATYFCPLWELEDITHGCARRLAAIGANAQAIDTVFIGSAHGEDDKFRTPLGDQYGVELHAFSAFSQAEPVNDLKRWSFLIDIAIGIVSALFFQTLWSTVVQYEPPAVRRYFLIAAAFLVLIIVAFLVIWAMPRMLQRGLWMNPLMLIVGLFIDSYGSAIEQVKSRTAHTSVITPWHAFIGWPPQTLTRAQRFLHGFRELLLQWLVVVFGVYFALIA